MMLLGQPEMMISAGAHISISISKVSWRAPFWTGDRQAWWMAISNAISGPGLGLKCESVWSGVKNIIVAGLPPHVGGVVHALGPQQWTNNSTDLLDVK